MGSKKLAIGLLIMILSIVLTASCTCCSTETVPTPDKAKSIITYDNIEVTLLSDKTTYELGETVIITLTVSNKGTSPLKFTFPSTQQYDFVITMEGEESWRWSHDKMFAAVLTEVILPPSESVVYREKWPQQDNQGKLVSPGKYQVIGFQTTQPQISSYYLTIEITE